MNLIPFHLGQPNGERSWGLHTVTTTVFVIAIAYFTEMAFADWQGTVWNSSPEQADKVFLLPHRASTQSGFPNIIGAAPIVFDDYRLGDLAFHKGRLYFRDGKLNQIWMSLEDPSLCEKLITRLQVTYGKPAKDETTQLPAHESSDHLVTWYDQKNNNQVEVLYRRYTRPRQLNLDDDCDLRYEPFVIPSPGQP